MACSHKSEHVHPHVQLYCHGKKVADGKGEKCYRRGSEGFPIGSDAEAEKNDEIEKLSEVSRF